MGNHIGFFSLSDFEDDGEDESDGGWQQELQRRYAQEANFMAELRARHPSSPGEPVLPICEEYIEGNSENQQQNFGPFAIQVVIIAVFEDKTKKRGDFFL